MKEIAKKAWDATKATYKAIGDRMEAAGEKITPAKIGAAILGLYLLGLAVANALLLPYLTTWLIIVLPLLLFVASATAVMVKPGSVTDNIWSFMTFFCQGLVIGVALLSNMLPILLIYSIPMYMLHRLTDTVVEERMRTIATKLHAVAFETVTP